MKKVLLSLISVVTLAACAVETGGPEADTGSEDQQGVENTAEAEQAVQYCYMYFYPPCYTVDTQEKADAYCRSQGYDAALDYPEWCLPTEWYMPFMHCVDYSRFTNAYWYCVE